MFLRIEADWSPEVFNCVPPDGEMVSQQVKINIVHGDLGSAQYPVAVGHYYGDIVTSAEAYLNRCLDNCLMQRYRLGLYPGELETATVFLNPDEFAKPAGAIVVGLGKVGELTSGCLTRSFARAALAYVIAVSESSNGRFIAKKDTPKSAGIATLLLGTGQGGIPVEESVIAILRGVQRANLAIKINGYDQQVVIDSIEFIELWEDIAILASRALEQVSGDPYLREDFDWRDSLIRRGPGGQVRVAFSEPPGWWRRLQIFGDADGSLRFNMMTDRARSEVSLLSTQRILVDQFVRGAIRNTGREDRVGKTLFELLVPNALKEQELYRQHLLLILNDEAAHYPWELLENRSSDDGLPLAVEVGVLRQLETPIFRERVSTVPKNWALVIGDPKSSLVPLESAQKEADLVQMRLLDAGFQVVRKVGATALEIVGALFESEYRILHLSGHGVYNQELPGTNKKVSGMVIGDGIVLAPVDVEQMRQIPELVFINCCHLGRIESENSLKGLEYHKLAANLAAQFIRMGVRAVVAAGWAVDDVAAQTFAGKFYERMLSGASFGQAVLAARQDTYKAHPGVNTWGAYQCYGDPGYSLSRQATRGGTNHGKVCFHAPSEAIAALKNLANHAATASREQVRNLRERLQELTNAEYIPSSWLRFAGVRAALGNAYGEMELFPEALTHYEAALGLENADFSFQAIEQMANLQSRWAVQCWKDQRLPTNKESGSLQTIDFRQKIDQGIALLNKLCEFGVTGERLSLLGSAHKHKAWVTSGKERRDALVTMRDSYRQAYELLQEKTGTIDPYSLLNWLTAEIVLSWLDPGQGDQSPQEPFHRLAQVERERPDPGFWNSSTAVQCALTRHLAQANLGDNIDAVVRAYRAEQLRGASPREFRSVLDHLEFLMEMLQGEADKAAPRQDLSHALRTIFERLSALVA